MADYLFDAGEMFKSQGLSLVGATPEGKPLIQTPDQQVGEFDTDGYLKAQGLDPKKAQLQYNTPDTALPHSPLTVGERLSLSFANSNKGQEQAALQRWSKEKGFEGVASTEQGLSVQKNGIYYQVDPSFFGDADPWKLAKGLATTFKGLAKAASYDPKGGAQDMKQGAQQAGSELGKAASGAYQSLTAPGAGSEIASDLVEGIPTAIKTGAEGLGAAAGSTLGPAGSIAGAGAGGALGSKVVTSLGRIVGTYDPGPDHTELYDNLTDGVLSMGGQAVAIGARPLAQQLEESFKSIAKGAAGQVKDLLGTIWAGTSGADVGAVKYALHSPEDFFATQAAARQAAGTAETGAVRQVAQKRMVDSGEELLTGARGELSRQYGQGLEALFNAAEKKNMSVDMGELVAPVRDTLDSLGMGKVIPTKAGGFAFRPFTEKEVLKMEAQGIQANVLPDEVLPVFQKITNEVLSRSQTGKVDGRAAAQILTKIQKNINQYADSEISPGAKDMLDVLVAKLNSGIKTGIGEFYDRAGLSKEWTDLSSNYMKFKDAVDQGTQIARRMGGIEPFVRKMIDESGRRGTAEAQGTGKLLVELMGNYGQKLYKDMVSNNAVSEMAPWFHKGLLQVMGAGGAGMALATGTKASAGAVLAIAPQFSPRAISSQIYASRKAMSLLQHLGPNQMDMLLKNPQAFEALVRPIVEAPIKEQMDAHGLLQQATQ